MKLTLITTTYNSETTLRDAFSSVLGQSFADMEYIVVDGASTDGTLDIIKEYAVQFEGKMKWLSERDCGLYDAMNKGLQMATGDVVGFLNSDDYFTSGDILSRVAEEFRKDQSLDAVYGDVHYVKPGDPARCVRYYSSEDFTRSRMRRGFMPAHPSFYAKRGCYERFGCFETDYKICADFELLLRFIYVHRIRTKYIPLDMVTMRMGGVSTRGLKSHICIMKEHLRACRKNKVPTHFLLLLTRYFSKLKEFRR